MNSNDLKEAYRYCESVTREHAKSFYFANKFLTKDKQKAGLGLGIFIGKTLLEKNYAKILFRNSETRGGAEIKIEWTNKNLIKI